MPAPVLVSWPVPPIAPPSVSWVPAAVEKVPPFSPSVTARPVAKLAVVTSVPASRLSAPLAAPRLASAPILQRAAIDSGAARVAVGRRQDEQSGVGLGQQRRAPRAIGDRRVDRRRDPEDRPG